MFSPHRLGLVLVSSAALIAVAPAARADSSVLGGARLGYVADPDAPLLGGELLFKVVPAVYFNPNVEFVFKGDSYITANADFHYDLPLRGGRTTLWAGAGLGFVSVNPKGPASGDTQAGLNMLLGAARTARAGGLGLGAGVVDVEGAPDSSLYFTGNIRFRLLGPVNLEPEVGYWKQTQDGVAVQTRTEDLSLGVNGLLVAPLHPLELFAGAGLGAHFVDRSAGIGGLVGESSDTRTGVHLLAGVDLRLSEALNLFGAARRDRFGDDQEPEQTKFYGGLRFKF